MSRPIRVLVADDEKNLRELMVRELSRQGHQVEGVADGEAALDRLREAPYDVVILDMKMPRKEGIEVLRELAGFPEQPQVIVMTGFQDGIRERIIAGNPHLLVFQLGSRGLTGAEGAFLDPLSGDFLFTTFGGGNRLIAIRGFTPNPQ